MLRRVGKRIARDGYIGWVVEDEWGELVCEFFGELHGFGWDLNGCVMV